VFTPTARRGRRSLSARRRPLAVLTAAFVVAQTVSFNSPANSAPGGLISLTTPGAAVSENFNSLPQSGTTNASTTLPTSWDFVETGGNTTYAASTGTAAAGDVYSYGSAAAPGDRALGELDVNAVTPITIGAGFTNDTGSAITSLDISYAGEQWRAGNTAAARDDRLDFQISTDATSLSTGTYTDVNALDFVSPVRTAAAAGALDGNAAANRTAVSSTVSGLSIPDGATFWIRWVSINPSGNDDGLAVDDFSITPRGAGVVVRPVLAVNDVSHDEGDAGTTAFTFTVNLSRPAPAGGVGFNWSTADGTTNPATAGGDYVAVLNQPGSIPETQTSATFTVQVNGDAANEPDETFFVNVSNVNGATPGDVQGLGTVVNDDVTITPIHQIQGVGAASPFVGANVTTTGVVTLLRKGTGTGGAADGFFIQTPDAEADSDPNTSQGLLVFTNAAPAYNATGTPVAVGDEVRVTGTVAEFFNMTELSPTTDISIIDTGNPLPTAVTLTATILDPSAPPAQPQLEKFEGMRVGAASLRTVAPNDSAYDVETVLGGVPRPSREPGVEISTPAVPPDPGGAAPDCCVPRWDENPERLKVDTDGRDGSPLNPYTSNVTFSNIAGPLDFSSGEYKLIPEATPTASANMSAVPVPAPTANEFTVAGFNIENFDNDATQRRKAALAIRDVMRLPHIVGVAEIFELADLQALAAEVNTISPGASYTAHLVESDGSTTDDGDQDVGYLVDTSRVAINSVTQTERPGCDGTPAACNTYTDPNNGLAALLNDRPPLVLTANVQPSGANLPVIVVVNHMRSFICIDADVDPAVAARCDGGASDGPRVRAKRKAQGEFLADLLQDLQTANPTTPVISVGDYNAYQFSDGFTDPVATVKGDPMPDDRLAVDQSPDLVNPDFVNLVDGLAPDERYSFVFEGTPQALDHVIINAAARARNTRFRIARNNADFPENPAATFLDNAARPERNSDHDMPVAYFSLDAATAEGSLVISEFRFRGPGPDLSEAPPEITGAGGFGGFDLGGFGGPEAQSFGGPAATFSPQAPDASADTSPQANDEFIEFYNNTDSDIFVAATDGSGGWALVAADGRVRFVIPSGTTIPARGHYLAVNTLGYSLSGYRAGFGEAGPTGAVGDTLLDAEGSGVGGYALDIPDNSGVALFRTANPANFTLSERLDAAGYAGVPELYREGAGFPPGGAETAGGPRHTFFRDYRPTGRPKDTGNNVADFLSADTAAAAGLGLGQKLGAPGPENSTSPVERSSDFFVAMLNPAVSSTAAPNRVRKLCGAAEECVPNRSQFGTMSIRRTVRNNTGAAVARLRFRVVEVSAFPRPNAATADIRAIDSGDIRVLVNGQPLEVRGTTVEQPPGQPLGGGWNTSLNVGFVNLDRPLADGGSVSVQFLLGVQQTGNFKFFLNIEALPDPNVVLRPAARR
jgi:uncharacterized protein